MENVIKIWHKLKTEMQNNDIQMYELEIIDELFNTEWQSMDNETQVKVYECIKIIWLDGHKDYPISVIAYDIVNNWQNYENLNMNEESIITRFYDEIERFL